MESSNEISINDREANATRIESYRLFVLAPPRWLVSPLAIVRSAVEK